MKKVIGLLVLSTVVLLGACSKYDEGGSVNKAEKNLTKEWSMERAFKNGNSVEVVNANPQIGEVTEDWKFNKDGTCRTEDGEHTLKGTWALSSDSKSVTVIITTPASKASTETYEIVKLTKGSDGELIWKQTIGTDEYRYEMRSSS
ncbi:MAG: hypothetical protein ACFHU9_01640 [Fluviicola sp.]